MMRSVSTALITACALAAAVGAASSARAINVGPSSLYLWTNHDYGAGVGNAPGAVGYNGAATPVWTWQPSSFASQPWIDENGRIYATGAFRSTPQPGSVAATTNIFGIFTATSGITNSPDLNLYQSWATGQTDPANVASNYKLLNNAGSSTGISTSSYLRVSGSMVGLGVQIGNPLGSPVGTGINESTTAALVQNNTEMFVGNLGSQSLVARMARTVSVPNSSDWTAAPSTSSTFTDITNYRTTLSQQFSCMDRFGNTLAPLTFSNATQAQTAGSVAATAPVTATTALAATTGNQWALGLTTPSGNTTIVAQCGDQPLGAGGPQFANGSNGTSTANGVGGFFMGMNRSGQVAYDATFLARGTLISGSNYNPGPGGVTTANDSSAWIYTPGSGTRADQNTWIYQEGLNAPTHVDAISGLSTSNGSALTSGGIATGQAAFSNAGLFYSYTPAGGDTVTTGTNPNNQFIAVSRATASTGVSQNPSGPVAASWVMRKNDIAPGFTVASDVHLGSVNTSSMRMNNSGQVAFGAQVQSVNITNPTAVISGVAYQYNQFGDGLITSTGVQGNDQALFVGNPGSTLAAIARKGDLAPGMGGRYLDLSISSLNMNMNNRGDVVFTSGLTAYAAGQTIGVVGQTPAASIISDLTTVLYTWNASWGLVPLLYTNQSVEVEPGVFKYISQFGASGVGSGDGGSMTLNDSGQLVVWTRFSETPGASATSTGYLVLQVPAPATGVLGLAGVGALARRRRRN